MQALPRLRREPVATILNAGMTLAVVTLAFGALDDITTDVTAPGFIVERLVLLGCAIWLGLLAARLLRSGHPLPGWVSLGAIAGAAWGQAWLAPGEVWGHPLEYALVAGALLWFFGLSAALGWRAMVIRGFRAPGAP